MSGADRIEQLELMRSGTEGRFLVRCRNYAIQMRPLTIMEETRLAMDAQCEMQKLPDAQQNRMMYDQIFTQKVLELASTSAPNVFDPKLTAFVVSMMTVEEVLHLWKQYIAGKDRLNPSLESLPLEDVKAMVAELKKKPSAVIERSFLDLVNCCQYLLNELPKDN